MDTASPRAALRYQSGFGSEFASEALPGALPEGQNSPQRACLRTLRRAILRHRLHRSAARQSPLVALSAAAGADARRVSPRSRRACCSSAPFDASRRRRRSCAGIRCRCRPRRPTSSTGWSPWPATATSALQGGCGIHLYAANRSMRERYFYNADGELLLVPQQGALRLATELACSTSRRARSR